MDPTAWNVPFPVVVAALFGIVMARANGTYWLGRLGSAGARRTRLARVMDSAGFRRAASRIDRYGAPVVALSFLTIGFQTLANLAAGTTGMKLRHYLPAVSLGSLAWALLYGTLGTVGVDLFGDLWGYSPALAIGLGALALAAITGFVLLQHRRSAQASTTQAPDSFPA